VAAHLTVGWNVSLPRFAWGMVRHRGFNGFNVVAAKQLAERPTSEIVDDLRSNADTQWTPPGIGAIGPLSDAIIHTADLRRPLGIASQTPLVSLLPVLDSLAEGGKRTPFPLKDPAGLRFQATDQEWSTGSGALVEGPSEALALAMAGRSIALDELSGDGVAEFRRRVG